MKLKSLTHFGCQNRWVVATKPYFLFVEMYSPLFNFSILGFDICYQASVPLLRTSSKHQETLRKYCRITELTLSDTHSKLNSTCPPFVLHLPLVLDFIMYTLYQSMHAIVASFGRIFLSSIHTFIPQIRWIPGYDNAEGLVDGVSAVSTLPCPVQPGTYPFTFARSLSFPLFAEGVMVAGVPFRHD